LGLSASLSFVNFVSQSALLQKGLNHKGHEVHKGFLEGSIENLEFQRTIVWKNFVFLCALCGKTGFCSGLIVIKKFRKQRWNSAKTVGRRVKGVYLPPIAQEVNLHESRYFVCHWCVWHVGIVPGLLEITATCASVAIVEPSHCLVVPLPFGIYVANQAGAIVSIGHRSS